MNALERATIAKEVAGYIIDNLLLDNPVSAQKLGSLAKTVTEDRAEITDAKELERIARLTMDYVSKDPRVVVKSKGKGVLWIHHKESPPRA